MTAQILEPVSLGLDMAQLLITHVTLDILLIPLYFLWKGENNEYHQVVVMMK